jgi:hypothetical protein
MLLMASSPGLKVVQALEIAKKSISILWWKYQSYFSFPSFDDNFDLTNAKISNAELDEQLKEIVRDFQM